MSSTQVYVLCNPSGTMLGHTMAADRRMAWVNAFDHIARLHPEFRTKYWKRWEASQAWARRNGWRVVKAALTEKS